MLPAATAAAQTGNPTITCVQPAEVMTVYGATNTARLVINSVSVVYGWRTWSRSVVLGKFAAALFVVTTTKLVGKSFVWQGLESVWELIPG